MLRFLTAGESHGPELTAILDGFPAGLHLDLSRLNEEMRRRQQGYGRGARQKLEADTVEITGGVRHGITTGAPLALTIRNRDWKNWEHVMSVTPVDMSDAAVKAQIEKKAITRFRPGHADLPGTFKFRHREIRDVLERASARETAARVAVGALCLQLLECFGARVASHVIQVGPIKARTKVSTMDLRELDQMAMESELFCIDSTAAEEMKALIKQAWQEGDTLGGTVEVIADGLPIGLGAYTQWDKRLDGQIAQALMSVQAMKAVEIGEGFSASSLAGSKVHDALYPCANAGLPFRRETNHAGGLEGGMTNGSRLIARAYMKPIPTLRKGLPSVSFPGFTADTAHFERSDVCAIAAAAVVCRAMVSFVLARSWLDKFGSDTVDDIKAAQAHYMQDRQDLGSVCPAQSPQTNVEAESE